MLTADQRIGVAPPLSSLPRNRLIRRLTSRTRCARYLLALAALAARHGGRGAATLGDAQIGFSADRTLVIDGQTYRGKIWTMPGKERHEQVIQGFQPVFILRADSPFGEIVLAKAAHDGRSS